MKNIRRIAAVFFPSLFTKQKDKMPGIALLLLLIMFLFVYVSSVILVRNAAGEAYSGVEEVFEETGDFCMSSAKFKYDGHYEGVIGSLRIALIIDGDSDTAPEVDKNSVITVFAGPNEASVSTKFGCYTLNYAELEKSLGESIDFDKKMAREELGYGKAVFMNIVVSASVLIGIVLFFIFLLCILIITIPVFLLYRLIGAKIDFSRTLAVVMGSFVYPLLISGLFFWIPDGLKFAVNNITSCMICFLVIMFAYIFLAIIPLLISEQKEQGVYEKSFEKETVTDPEITEANVTEEIRLMETVCNDIDTENEPEKTEEAEKAETPEVSVEDISTDTDNNCVSDKNNTESEI